MAAAPCSCLVHDAAFRSNKTEFLARKKSAEASILVVCLQNRMARAFCCEPDWFSKKDAPAGLITARQGHPDCENLLGCAIPCI
jgi:hypothetical protein